jgi:hypothetical protein
MIRPSISSVVRDSASPRKMETNTASSATLMTSARGPFLREKLPSTAFLVLTIFTKTPKKLSVVNVKTTHIAKMACFAI